MLKNVTQTGKDKKWLGQQTNVGTTNDEYCCTEAKKASAICRSFFSVESQGFEPWSGQGHR